MTAIGHRGVRDRAGAFSRCVRRHNFRAGAAALAVAATVSVLTPAPADAATIYLYWANSGAGVNEIGRANSNGTSVNQDYIDVGGAMQFGVWSLTVNGTNIYWTDFRDGTIGRANLNGTGVNKSFISGLGEPEGIAVNGTNIYWADGSTGKIGRANLNGTGVNKSFITPSKLALAEDVALGPSGNYIYWTNGVSPGIIGRANLNGTGVNNSFIKVSGNEAAQLAVNSTNIYWSEPFPSGNLIGRANLNGTGVNQSFITVPSASDVQGIGLGPANNYIYWTDYLQGNIGRAKLNGTGITSKFITSASSPIGVVAH